MQLQRGVVVYQESAVVNQSRQRLMISTGLQRASEAEKASEYCSFAVLPQEPWLTVTDEQFETCFLPGPAPDPGAWISIVKVPDSILVMFAVLTEASRTNQPFDQINWLIDEDPQVQAGRQAVFEFCAEFAASGEDFIKGSGIRTNAANLRTVTRNKEGCFIGLHLDSWFPAPLAERRLSPNRIVLNLGADDRYFLFINLTLQQIAGLVDAANPPGMPARKYDADLLEPFLHLYPDYPVSRLRLGLGEAYIAPTENILHEGSTLGIPTPDVQLTVLGHFGYKRC